MTHIEFFGILSTALMLIGRANYLNAVFRGNTRPHSFSWLIWGVISGIGFAAQVAEGAGAGSWARGFGAATCFILVIIGLMKGERDVTRGDWITLAVATSAIPLWVATKTPVYSVILVVIIDLIGYLPTLRKAWMKPFEENAVSFSISGFCALSSLFAIEHFNLSTWLYPASLVFSNFALVAYLIIRRKHPSIAGRVHA